ncbi:MAG: hypothetical protein U0264_02650 [Candidatus Kapaibacterium sp.]
MKILFQSAIIILVIALSGCGALELQNYTKYGTRIEQDAYSMTIRDTTIVDTVTNNPGDSRNGIIYPSSRKKVIDNYTSQYDSIVERRYPNFIRLGVFESVGLVGTSDSKVGVGSGMFGILGYLDPDFRFNNKDSNRNVFFTGGLYRFGIAEWRLRWFHDAKDWTFGFSGYEAIIPEIKNEQSLQSFLPFYVRKRYYLREQIPYISVTPSVGFGFFPSHYVNISTSLDVGSMGGFNIRAYVGLASGINRANTFLNDSNKAVFPTIPYVGLGVSLLDFINRVPELYTEWKDHEHSSWNIGVLQLALLTSGAEGSIFDTNNSKSLVKGIMLRLAPVSLALPFLDTKLYASTSFMNIVSLGQNQFGAGILPVRLGYFYPLNDNELSVEPFIEYNYYPSNFVHLGGKFNLKMGELANFYVQAGWVNGSTSRLIDEILAKHLGVSPSLSGFYLGLGIGVLDKIFTSKELRYNR